MADDSPPSRPAQASNRRGRQGAPAGGSGNQPSSGRRPAGSGNRGGSNRGGSNRSAQGGGRSGSNRSPQGGGRSSANRSSSGRPRSAGGPQPDPAPTAAAVRAVAGASEDDRRAAANGHRAVTRAVVWSITPAVVVGAVAGLVLGAIAGVVAGLIAAVVAGALVWAAAWSYVWRRADQVVLRAIGARPAAPGELRRIENLVDGLCATMGLAQPSLAVVRSDRPNAMAVGRTPDSATLVVTDAVETALSVVELEGLLAHELVHIKRRDTAVASVVVAAAAPLAALGLSDAERVHAAVGEDREFQTDRRAASVVRYPPGLGSVLAAAAAAPPGAWPPGGGRTAALTRWLWIDPVLPERDPTGQLDLPAVRAAALAEW